MQKQHRERITGFLLYCKLTVLSRQHSEIWEKSSRIYSLITVPLSKAKKLSPEGTKSEPFELKADDIAEFGFDIVNGDNETLIQVTVNVRSAARVVCTY